MNTTHVGIKFIRALKIRFSEYTQNRVDGVRIVDKTKICEPFSAMLHPIKKFNSVKTEGFGSSAVATVIWLCFFLLSIIEYFENGFVFNYNLAKDFNIFYKFATSAAIILVWCIVNWALCTLLDGKGNFREIWIVVCYGMMPKIVFGLPMVALSHILCIEESTIYLILQFVIGFWCAISIFIGLLIIHEYSFSKTVFSCLFTAIGMIALVYILLLLVSMIQQLTSFIETVFKEAMSRR